MPAANVSTKTFYVGLHERSRQPATAASVLLSLVATRVHMHVEILTLLAQLRLALLDGGQQVVADASGGQPVQASAHTTDCNDVQVLCTRVVTAVHDGAHWQGQRHAELLTRHEATSAHLDTAK